MKVRKLAVSTISGSSIVNRKAILKVNPDLLSKTSLSLHGRPPGANSRKKVTIIGNYVNHCKFDIRGYIRAKKMALTALFCTDIELQSVKRSENRF